MADDEHHDERDPLLVRPFILRESGGGPEPHADDPPAVTTPPPVGHPGSGDPDATAVIHLPDDEAVATGHGGSAGNPAARSRRMFLLAAICAAALVGVGVAGFAALGGGLRPAVTAAEPREPLPVVTGPVVSATVSRIPSDSTQQSSSTEQGTGPGSTAGGGTVAGAGSSTTSTKAPNAATTATAATSPAVTEPATADPSRAVPSPTTILAPDPDTTTGGGSTGVIRGQNGVCLDLNGALPIDGNYIQVFECNNSAAQNWTLATDGTLRVLGKCALLVGDGAVHIVSCDGRTTAQWRISGQRLINAANDGCLTDSSGGRRSGARVAVTTCAGSASQRWSLP